MFGIYYKTLYRNQETGFTKFYIVPNESCENLSNGLLFCEGIIGIYLKNTPICLEGKFSSKSFKVTDDYIPVDTEENAISFLEYITDELTENQKVKIAEYVHNDLFLLATMSDSYSILKDILKRSKNGEQIAAKIIKKISSLKNKEDMTKKLLKYKIPLDRIELLYRKNITLKKLKESPYMTFIKYGIDIDKAELFAQNNCNIEPYSLERILGFVYDAVNSIVNAGHSCCTIEQLLNNVNFRLMHYGVYDMQIEYSLLNLCLEQLKQYIQCDVFNGKIYVYLNHVWNEEEICIENIKRLQTNKHYFEPKIQISQIEERLGITYNQEQKNAFNAMLSSGIKILTGPPGSGKTATINGLIEYYKLNTNGKIKLAATTGAAAKVMRNACSLSSETVNMMLNVMPYDNGVNGRDLNNPIDAEVIIVDESSMLGLQLFSVLVQAIKSGSILILVGDDAQLQSVEYGNVLGDLINSGCIEVFRLTEIIRQSGTICENAQNINRGYHNLVNDETFKIYKCSNNNEVIKLLAKNLDKKNAQVLCPIKKGDLSTTALNKLMQNKNRHLEMAYGNNEYYMYDKVIMTRTNYEKNYINGDIGYVVGSDDERLIVQFPDKKLILDRQDMYDMDLAWATTIHKSQGSEFTDVHIILPKDAINMMSRRMVYTAVTRAKQRVFIYFMEDTLDVAISNKREAKRMSLLSYKLEKNLKA